MSRLVVMALLLAGCRSVPAPAGLASPLVVPLPQERLLADATATGCEWNATQMRWHYPPDAQGNPVLSPMYDITNCTREAAADGCRWQWRCPP